MEENNKPSLVSRVYPDGEYCSFPTTSSSPVPWTNELNLKQGDSPLHSEAVNWTAGQTP